MDQILLHIFLLLFVKYVSLFCSTILRNLRPYPYTYSFPSSSCFLRGLQSSRRVHSAQCPCLLEPGDCGARMQEFSVKSNFSPRYFQTSCERKLYSVLWLFFRIGFLLSETSEPRQQLMIIFQGQNALYVVDRVLPRSIRCRSWH